MNCIIGQELFIQICLKQCMYELYNRSSIVYLLSLEQCLYKLYRWPSIVHENNLLIASIEQKSIHR